MNDGERGAARDESATRATANLQWALGLVLASAAVVSFVFATRNERALVQNVPQSPAGRALPIGVNDAVARAGRSFVDVEGQFAAVEASHSVRVDSSGHVRFSAAQRRSPFARGRSPKAFADSALSFHTEDVVRGNVPLTAERTTAHVANDGAVVRSASRVVERIENTRQGVEQSWAFETKPEGAGDLAVRVSVGGLSFVGLGPEGATFAATSSKRGAEVGSVRYSNATWVDASGRKTDVPLAYEDGHLVMRVPSRVVDDASYPAVLDPLVSAPAFTASGDGPGGADPAFQSQPSVAFDGTNYLVVWLDGRFPEAGFRVVGVRVGPGGDIVGAPGGFPIGKPLGADDTDLVPDVAFDGTQFVVAYNVVEAASTTQDFDVYATRVSTAGVVQDPQGLPVGVLAGSNQRGPKVACARPAGAPPGCAVVWTDDRSGTPEIYGALVPSVGAPGGTGTRVVTGAVGAAQSLPAIASSPTGYVLAFRDSGPFEAEDDAGAPLRSRIRLASFDAAFAATAATGFIAAPGDSLGVPSIAYTPFDGAPAFTVAHLAEGPLGEDNLGRAVYASLVNADLQVEDAIAVTPSGASTVADPKVAFDGRDAVLVWADYTAFVGPREALEFNVGAVRLRRGEREIDGGTNASALVQDGPVFDVAPGVVEGTIGAQEAPAIARGRSPGAAFVVWGDHREPSPTDVQDDVVAATLEASRATTRTVLSTTGENQTNPAVASDGKDFLLVWDAFRSGPNRFARDVFAVRIVSGIPVLPPIVIADEVDDESHPAVAFDGSGYVVAWADSRSGQQEVYARRVGRDGIARDGSVRLSEAPATEVRPVATSTGSGTTLVAWQERRGEDGDIVARLFKNSPEGALITVAGAPGNQAGPSVAFGNGTFLVAWQTTEGERSDVRAGRVTLAGGTPDRTNDASDGLPVAAVAGRIEAHPSVAFGNGTFVVAWDDGRNRMATDGNFDIAATRVLPSGAVQPDDRVMTPLASKAQESPAVTFDGSRFLLAWADARSSVEAAEPFTEFDLRGMFVTASSTDALAPLAVDGGDGQFVVDRARFFPVAIGLSSTPNGQSAIVGVALDELLRAPRLVGHLASGLGAPCVDAKLDCPEGAYCANGVCSGEPASARDAGTDAGFVDSGAPPAAGEDGGLATEADAGDGGGVDSEPPTRPSDVEGGGCSCHQSAAAESPEAAFGCAAALGFVLAFRRRRSRGENRVA